MKRTTIRILTITTGCLLATALAAAEQTNHGEATMPQQAIATFAGGCFWCMQPAFDHVHGVLSTRVGYTGGTVEHPTYEQVCTGTTGHAEAVEVTFDPATVSYAQLLDVFWKNIDPTTLNQQFADVGTQYRTAIFYQTDEQRRLAEASKAALERSGKFGGKPIVTEIVPASTFYPAEDSHQKYYRQCPLKYQLYKAGSGREGYLHKTWGASGK